MTADGIEPLALKNDIMPSDHVTQYSLAISAKRQADALERIAKSLERLAHAEYNGSILTRRGG
jgi:hypothetical protein